MSKADREAVALKDAEEYFGGRSPELVISENDIVAMMIHEIRGTGNDEYDYFGFRVARVVDGSVVEVWTNSTDGSAPIGSGRADAGRSTVSIGEGDPAANKVRATDFFRCVFDSHNAEAVPDFYAQGFIQHARTQAQTVEETQEFVRMMFPDGPIATPTKPDLPTAVVVGEGDLVVIASQLPQRTADGHEFIRNLFDAFRVRDGMLVEHWSGQDPENMPQRLGLEDK